MKKRISLIWLIGLLLAGAFAAAAQNNQTGEEKPKANPMKKSDVVKALESNAISSKELAERINQRGVDFQLDDKAEQQLKNAGAGQEVLEAVRAGYQAPAKKKGLFGKVADGMGKAAAKTKETVSKTPASTAATVLFPPAGIAIEAAKQAQKQKGKESEKAETAAKEETAPQSNSSAKSPRAAAKENQSKSAASPANKTGEKTPVKTTATGGNAPANLSGTYWSLLSMTKKGQTPKDSSAPPDVEFCKNGEWGILHYGGRTREAGTFKLAGARLAMKYEDGTLYGDYKVTREANMLILDDGEYVLRLRYAGAASC